MKLAVQSELGVTVLRDGSQEALLNADLPAGQLLESLRSPTRAGEALVLHDEDGLDAVVEVLTEIDSAPSYLRFFSQASGNLLLRLPTGKLVVRGMGPAQSSVSEVHLSAGDYAVTTFHRYAPNMELYTEELTFAVGAEAVALSAKVDRLALLGCLSFVLVLGLIAPPLRPYWPFVAVGALAGWVPYAVGSQLPSYRKARQSITEYDRRLPAYVLRLQRIESTQGLVGGVISV